MKNIKRTDIGSRLVILRDRHNFKQSDVAEKIGISRDRYAKYETDTVPPAEIIAKLAQLFGVTTDALIKEYPVDYTMINAPKSNSKLSTFNNYVANGNAVPEDYMKKIMESIENAVTTENVTGTERNMLSLFRELTNEQQTLVMKMIQGLTTDKKDT